MVNEDPPQEQNGPSLTTSLRYLSYASQLGESFRYVIGPKMVAHTYSIAITYILADTFHQSIREYKRQKDKDFGKIVFVGADNLIWQMFASVVFPSMAIRSICSFFYNRLHRLPSTARGISVASVGLMAIPIIVRPIDDLVDSVLDVTLRKFAP